MCWIHFFGFHCRKTFASVCCPWKPGCMPPQPPVVLHCPGPSNHDLPDVGVPETKFGSLNIICTGEIGIEKHKQPKASKRADACISPRPQLDPHKIWKSVLNMDMPLAKPIILSVGFHENINRYCSPCMGGGWIRTVHFSCHPLKKLEEFIRAASRSVRGPVNPAEAS